MKTKTYKNTLLQDVEKVNLVALVGDKKVKTNLFGIYSPSVEKVIIECKSKFVPTTNDEFVKSVEEISNQFDLNIDNIFSLSDGGKMCSWLEFKNVYETFDVPTKLKRNKQKLDLTANLYIIETNDTTSKLQVGVQLIINGESAFLINGLSTISSYRSSSPYSLRKQELPKLINNAIDLTNKFISSLNDLFLMDSNLQLEDEIIKDIFTKNEVTSEKMVALMGEVESNSQLNKKLFGDNFLSLAVSLGYFLFNKHDLFIDSKLENYLFSTLKKKNDYIIEKLNNLTK